LLKPIESRNVQLTLKIIEASLGEIQRDLNPLYPKLCRG
jgi:hypothetical protein